MPRIDFDKWRGELPRYAPHITPEDYALCATNTKLWHGILQSFHCPELVCEANHDIKTMVGGCECITFPEETNIVHGFCDLNFMTGRSYPEVTDDLCGDWCRLGVPCPTNAPSFSSTDDCSGQITQFAYRYVNKYGHVGPPSYLSNSQCIGGSGTLSGIVIPDSSWCITHVDIIGSVSGQKTGNEKQPVLNTSAMFFGRFPISGSVGFSTDIKTAEEEIESMDNTPPPANLQGITATEFGLAGFEGKNVWYTKPNQPNAWPNSLCVDHEIKAIAYWNNNLIVMTDCLLYRFKEVISDFGYEFSRPFIYGGKKLPIIAGQKSVAITQAGVIFPSTHGLILADETRARSISDNAFAKDDWCRINPDSMVAVYSDYGYMFFNDTLSYVFETSDGTFQDDNLNSYRLSFNVDAAMVDCDGVLNFADGNKWYKWNHCSGIKKTYKCDDKGKCLCWCCLPYTYIREVRFQQEQRITDGVIVFDGSYGHVDLKIYDPTCRDRLLHEGTYTLNTEDCGNTQCDRKYFVLDSCSLLSSVKIVAEGCADVVRISLGTSRSIL